MGFMEQGDVANLGSGLTGAQREQAMIIAAQTPISTFSCPSKREMRPYPLVRNGFLAHNLQTCREGSCPMVRGDYQANSRKREFQPQVKALQEYHQNIR